MATVGEELSGIWDSLKDTANNVDAWLDQKSGVAKMWDGITDKARDGWHNALKELGIKYSSSVGEMIAKASPEDRKKFATPLMPVLFQALADAAGIERDFTNAYRQEELIQAFRILDAMMSEDSIPMQLEAKGRTIVQIDQIDVHYKDQLTSDTAKKAWEVQVNLFYGETIKKTAIQTGMLKEGLGTSEQIIALLAPPP